MYPRNTPPAALTAGFACRVCVSREPVISIDNLLSGEAYCVEAVAWNDSGPLQWSQPASRIVTVAGGPGGRAGRGLDVRGKSGYIYGPNQLCIL